MAQQNENIYDAMLNARRPVSPGDLKVFASTSLALIATTYFAKGGTWQDWESTVLGACNLAKATDNLFENAQNGSPEALVTIEQQTGLPQHVILAGLRQEPGSPNIDNMRSIVLITAAMGSAHEQAEQAGV